MSLLSIAKRIFRSEFVLWIIILLLSVATTLLIKIFFYDSFYMKSDDMENSILKGDFLLVDKTAYGIRIPFYDKELFEAPLIRGEVVIYKIRGSYNMSRCIGLPGDTIRLIRGLYYVNDKEIPQSPNAKSKYIFSSNQKVPVRGIMRKFKIKGDIKSGKGGQSYAYFSPLEIYIIRSSLRGGTFFKENRTVPDSLTYTATVPAGSYWLIQNNIKNSDIRHFEFIPQNDIVGKAKFVLFSKDPENKRFFCNFRKDRFLIAIR